MNKTDVLEAFAALSSGEQEAVRAQIAGKRSPQEEGDAGGFMPTGEQLLEQMKSGKNAGMSCRERVKKLAETCCVSGWRP